MGLFDLFGTLKKRIKSDSGNPVHSEWMGSDVSWRFYFLQDNLGLLADHESAAEKFRRKNFEDRGEHEHCAGCWTTISANAVSEYYEGPDPVHGSIQFLCPVCFSLYKAACEGLPEGVHFKLIEAVADHVCETLFVQDRRVQAVTVKIVKLAIAEANEKIGITMHRERPAD